MEEMKNAGRKSLSETTESVAELKKGKSTTDSDEKNASWATNFTPIRTKFDHNEFKWVTILKKQKECKLLRIDEDSIMDLDSILSSNGKKRRKLGVKEDKRVDSETWGAIKTHESKIKYALDQVADIKEKLQKHNHSKEEAKVKILKEHIRKLEERIEVIEKLLI
jgi:hypothetical protein